MNSCRVCEAELPCQACGLGITSFGTPGCAGGVCAEPVAAELEKLRELHERLAYKYESLKCAVEDAALPALRDAEALLKGTDSLHMAQARSQVEEEMK
jgi:hypothetical protein